MVLQPPSPYRRADRQMLISIAGAAGILVAGWLAEFMAPVFFDNVFFWGVGPLEIAWITVMSIERARIRCPICRKSIFARGLIMFGWPERTCSGCGRDLTIPEHDAR